MPILFIDKILNGISTPILDGRDVDKTIIIDPDPTTTLRKLANKAVIRSETLKIEFYDEDGIKKSEFDLKPQDLSQIISDISDLKDRADNVDNSIDAINTVTSDNAKAAKNAHDRADSAHKLASTAEGTSAANSTAIGEIKLKQSEHTGRIEGLETKQRTDRADIRSVEADVLATDGRIDEVDARIDGVDSEISGLKQKDLDIDNSIVSVNSRIDGIDTKIGQIDAKDEEQDGRITKVEEEINGGGNLGSFLRENTDISVNSILSNTGKFEFNENYFPPNSDIQSVENQPHEFYFVFKNEEGTTDAFLISKDLVDSKGKPIISVKGDDDNSVVINSQLFEILEDISKNAENIEKKVNSDDFDTLSSTVGSNTSKISEVETTANNADTLSKSNKTTLDGLVIPPDLSSEVSSNTSKISEVETTANAADTLSKANKTTLDNLPSTPSLEDYAKLNTDVSFNNVSLDGKISGLQSGEDVDTNAANIGDVKNRINAIDLPPDLTNEVSSNTSKIQNSLLKDEYGWNVDNKNIYNVTRLSKTNNSVNSSGLSINDADVNLHADTVGITNSNSSTTYAVFSAGGLNVNDYPITRVGSGGDTDSNVANIGDVKNRINAIDLPPDLTDKVDEVEGIAKDADSLSKDNEQRLNNLPEPPNLEGYAKLNDDVSFNKVETTGLEFKEDSTIQQASGKKIELKVGAVVNAEITESGIILGRDLNASNQNFNNLGDLNFSVNAAIVGKDLGNLSILNLKNISRNNSVESGTDGSVFIDMQTENELKLGSHKDIRFTIAGKTPLVVTQNSLDFSLLNSTMKVIHDHNIDIIVGGTTNVAFKSNGMKLLSPIDGNSQNINSSGDIHFNENKKLFGSKAGNLQLRYVNSLWRGDGNGSNIQFDAERDIRTTGDHIRWFHSDGTQYGGISKTGINLRSSTKIVGLPKGEDDNDATNIGHIKELIEEHSPASGSVDYENYINRTADGSHTFYETTSSEKNAWVTHTNNSQGTITYTFDYSRQGQEVVAAVENRSKRTIIVKLKVSQQDNTTIEVPKYSVLTARYVPDIGKYVYNVGSWFPTEQRVLKLSDLNYQSNSDPREVTKNIINAMPKNTIVIARHESGSGSKNTANKNRFVSKGDNNSCETEEVIAIIVKYDTDRATGFSTTQGGSGKAWSRILDGKRHAWFTSETANSFSLVEDINLEEITENQIFFTGDQGILESYVSDETGDIALRQLENYNVPKINEDVDELKEQNELGKSKKHYFLNESTVIVPWNNPNHQPVSEVHVLDSSEQISGLGMTVSDDFNGYYTGTYISAGSHSITASGLWTEQSYHNVFKNVESNKYLVFNVDHLKWQLLTSDIQPSHSVNAEATEIIDLGGRSQLPESFGDYAINLEIENVDSLDFIKAIISPDVDSDNKLLIYNFGSAKPSGYILVK